MVLTRRQAHILINQIYNLSINQKLQMADPVNYVLSPFKGNTNPGYPQGLKIFLQTTKDTVNEDKKLNISVSNAKDILVNFLSLA